MKFTIEFNNTRILLTADQVETLTNLLEATEQITNKYISSSGATKSHYLKLVEPYSILETLKFGAISNEEYDAMVLVTKLQAESNA